jgi:hypothetical protein
MGRMTEVRFDLTGPAAIGLDARGKRLYAVCLDMRGRLFWPFLNEERRFTSLDAFRSWWSRQDWCTDLPRDPARPAQECRVAVAADSRDQLGILAWLKREGVPLDEFTPVPTEPELNDQFEAWCLPKLYKRAFVLAFLAMYRMQGPLVAEWIWSELQLTEARLRELNNRLGMLYQAMPLHDPGRLVGQPCSARPDRYPF